MPEAEQPPVKRASIFSANKPTAADEGFRTVPKEALGADERAQLARVAEATGFSGRDVGAGQGAQRRRKTVVRDKQLNIKVTESEADRFYAMVNRQGLPLGVVFAQAISALEEKLGI